jgi:hypothetical protein
VVHLTASMSSSKPAGLQAETPKGPESPRTEIPPPPLGPAKLRLPFALHVRDVRKTSAAIEVDCVLEDSAGRSIQFMPITVGAKTTAPEIEAILQSTINGVAKAHYERDLAELTPEPENSTALVEILGRTYRGSIAR